MPLLSWATPACDSELRILYGPYINENIINLRLKPAHNEIERLTGCQVKYHVSANYVLFHKKIIRENYHMILIASAHIPYLTQLNYKRAASGLGPIKVTVFGKKTNNILALEDLIGKRLLINGDTSIAGLAWGDIAQNRIDVTQVQKLYSVNTDTLLLNLLKGKAEAAITFHQFYARLPNQLKNKFSILASLKIELPASIMMKGDLSTAIQTSIKDGFTASEHWTAKKPQKELTITQSAHKKLSSTFKVRKP